VILARTLAPHLLAEIPVVRATELKASPRGVSWSLESLAGILAEISEETACGAISFVTEIILDAQRRNEPVAWVAGVSSIWYPPDSRIAALTSRRLPSFARAEKKNP